MRLLLLSLAVVLPLAISALPPPSVLAAQEADRVTFLPGLPPSQQPSFAHYSGYIPVGGAEGEAGVKMYHYWMVESQADPLKDPVVLWLNGGPGCSSVLGFLREHGPWTPDQKTEGQLLINPYSWNKNATIIYLETPAPVGFSYGGNGTAGDDIVMDDNYHFLLGWFARFPQFAAHDFYITGESYAGQYVPQLAHRIVGENEAGVFPKINLKGFMVGNPSGISSGEWQYSGYKFYEMHGLLSSDEVETVAKACNYTQDALDDTCQDVQEQTWQNNLKGVNPYNILAPCVGDGPGEHPGCFTNYAVASMANGNAINGQTFVPCGNYNHSISYLNSEEVKKALHISPLAFPWTPCSEHLTYNQYKPGTPDLYRSMIGKIRMMVYSGDIDSCVPFLGTRRGVENLGLTRTSPYRPWFAFDQESQSMQIAGYFEDFQGVSFATVRGAGHMVPWDKPPAALALLNAFIHPQTAPLIRSLDE